MELPKQSFVDIVLPDGRLARLETDDVEWSFSFDSLQDEASQILGDASEMSSEALFQSTAGFQMRIGVMLDRARLSTEDLGKAVELVGNSAFIALHVNNLLMDRAAAALVTNSDLALGEIKRARMLADVARNHFLFQGGDARDPASPAVDLDWWAEMNPAFDLPLRVTAAVGEAIAARRSEEAREKAQRRNAEPREAIRAEWKAMKSLPDRGGFRGKTDFVEVKRDEFSKRYRKLPATEYIVKAWLKGL